MHRQTGLYRHRALIFFVCAATLAGAGTAAHAGVALGLSPMRAEYKTRPGEAISGPFYLVNEAAEKTRVRTEILDFYLDDNATPQFGPAYATEDAQTCRKWLTVNPMETELGPGERLTVRYTLRVPANAPPRGYHCAVGFTTLPPIEKIAGMGIFSAVRIVGALYVTVGETPPLEGELGGVALTRLGTPEKPLWNAALQFKNPGRIHYRPTGEVAVLDQAGAVIETAEVQSIPVLPERTQRLLVPLKTAFDGRTPRRLRVRVDLGGQEIQEALVDVR